MLENAGKAVVIGASGFVGSYLARTLRARGWEVLGTYHRHMAPGLLSLDIRFRTEVESFLTHHEPNLICLCAAEPNVDYCEEYPEETRATNVGGVENVALLASKIGARLMYFSSDYVFDGSSGPYSETDLPKPISEYGCQKAKSEEIVRKTVPDPLILRVTVL